MNRLRGSESGAQARQDGGNPLTVPLESAMPRTPLHRLQVDADLARFIDTEVLPGTGIAPDAFLSLIHI